MITLAAIYPVAGLFLLACAWQVLRDRANPRRLSSALFWGLLAVGFLAGDRLDDETLGLLVLTLAVIAGSGGLRASPPQEVDPQRRDERAMRLGHRLFLPAVAISLLTLAGALGLGHVEIGGTPLLPPAQATVIALGLACIASFLIALAVTREPVGGALRGARGMLEAIGWAALLPMMLAVLGGVFAKAGVGELTSELLTGALPLESRSVALLAYALGMAIFTMIMGNAFAAFPVMSIGIALPVLVAQHGADPAPLAAIGMLSGYCGTLLTPMAANFNIVPAALLGLRDQHAVIRAQIGTALPLFACNLVLLFLFT